MKGYKKLKDILDHTLKPACEKYGFITYRIINHWEQIVGKNLASLSHPIEISFAPYKNDDGLLLIGVFNPGFALEIQASELTIINKLANYFGYKAISKIRIKIVSKPKQNNQEATIKKNNPNLSNPSINHSADQLTKAENNKLTILIEKIHDQEIAAEIAALKEKLFK